MSLLIDAKFVTLVSHRLSRFTKKQNNLYNFRCPLCGDSKKNLRKKRGYIYPKQNQLNYTCHNCGVSTTFGNLIRQLDPDLYRQYVLERYKQGEHRESNYNDKGPECKCAPPVFNTTALFEDTECLADVPDDHYAKVWLKHRQIPTDFLSDLYFTKNFKDWVEKNDLTDVESHKLERLNDDPRIIIPFRDVDKQVTMVQGRALSSNSLRYLTVKVDKMAPKIFGLDRIDSEKHIYVTEGPFDSMFIENCLAVAGTDLTYRYPFTTSQTTIILDREPRNREIVKLVKKYIKKGFSVALFPDTIQGKDINDYVLRGMTQSQLHTMIGECTQSGLRAELALSKWRVA